MSLKAVSSLLALMILVACGKKAPPPSHPAPYVTVEKAIAKDVPYVIRTIGQAFPFNSVELTPQVSGELVELYFTDGAYVNEGDLLALIDPRPYQAQLEEAQGELDQAKASLTYNLEVVRRYRDLLPEDYVAVLSFEQYVSEAEVAAGKVEQFTGSVDVAQVNLGFTEIRSPISGRAGARQVDAGNIVYANQTTPLTTINQISPIEVDFSVPEKYFFDIQGYQNPDGLVVEASFIDDPNHRWLGKLFFYDNQISTTTGTLECKAIFTNEDESLWPGLWVNVVIHVYTIPQAVLVPTRSIRTDTQGNYLFVIKEDDTAEKRQIKLGQRFDDWQVVQLGAAAGEQVVTEGQLMVRAGGKVRIRASS